MELTNTNSEINKPGAVFHCRVQGDHGGYRKRMNLTPVTLICRSTGIRIMISHSIQLVNQLRRQKNYQPIYQSIKKDKKLFTNWPCLIEVLFFELSIQYNLSPPPPTIRLPSPFPPCPIITCFFLLRHTYIHE